MIDLNGSNGIGTRSRRSPKKLLRRLCMQHDRVAYYYCKIKLCGR
jgi:hypothetical protein